MLNSDSSYILCPTTSVHLFSLCRSALSLHSNICFFQNICSPYTAVLYPYVELSSKNLWRYLPWLFLHAVIFLKYLEIFFCSQNIFLFFDFSIIFYQLSS